MKLKLKTVLHFLRFRGSFLMTLLLLGLASHASAHALLDYSVPKVGSVVTNAPGQVLICFTTNLKLHGSSIEVRDAKGERVDKKDAHGDPRDWAKLVVSLPPLPSGVYAVKWRAVADDGHITEGHFKFTIKLAAG
jgi:methionine-rich copper-binding protein CopC